jgi:hypothetical protein
VSTSERKVDTQSTKQGSLQHPRNYDIIIIIIIIIMRRRKRRKWENTGRR